MMIYKLAYVDIKRFVVHPGSEENFLSLWSLSVRKIDWISRNWWLRPFSLCELEYTFFLYFFVIQLCDVISKWEQAMRQSQGRLDTSRVIKLSYKNRWLLTEAHSKRISFDRIGFSKKYHSTL